MTPSIDVKVLPPDPEDMNDRRAGWAEDTLQHFMKLTGTGAEDAICDLVCDIMHLCDRYPEVYGYWTSQLDRAEGHYEEETTDDPDDE